MRHLCLLALLASLTPALALAFQDDFATRRPGWQPLGGDWQWQDGALCQQRPADVYCLAVRGVFHNRGSSAGGGGGERGGEIVGNCVTGKAGVAECGAVREG